MEDGKIKSKEFLFWLFWIVTIIAAIGLVFFAFVFSNSLPEISTSLYVFLGFTTFLFLILMADSWVLYLVFSSFKKVKEVFGTETEKNSKKIEEFDKITRQLVRRDLELARANKRLAEIDATKSDFVSVAAHQLRTPLTGIKWSYMTLLEGGAGAVNEEQKKILENGLSTITHTIELVTDLLDVAHIEQGKYGFAFKKHSIIDIVKKALTRFEPVITEKKIKVNSEISDQDPLEIDVDEEKMTIAIENIFDNAVKYTPVDGNIYYSIKREKGQIKIVIRDSGIGIPRGEITRLFTKFFRATNAVRFQTDGTGLGLYLVKNIIESHGGKIMVASEQGKGTAFTITLPDKSENKSEEEN